MAEDRVLLEDSLRPVQMIVRCNGVLFNFLTPNTEHCLLYWARFCFTSLIMLSVSAIVAFQFIETAVTSYTDNTATDLFTNCLIFLMGSLSVTIQYLLFVGATQFQQFFECWQRIEMSWPDYFNGSKAKKNVQSLNIIRFIALIILIERPVAIIIYHLSFPSHPFFLSYYSFFHDRFNSYFITFIHAAIEYFMSFYWLLAEILFTTFYHHAGCAIEDLVSQVRHTSQLFFSRTLIYGECRVVIGSEVYYNVTTFRQIWQRYETIVHWVNRANKLFGVFVLATQLISFISVIVDIYMGFLLFKTVPLRVVTFLAVCILYGVQIVLIIRVLSRFRSSFVQLQSVIAGLLSDEWYLLSDEDRQLLLSFLGRLNHQDLVACSMNLFTIHPISLLKILFIIFTYMVTVFQRDGLV